MERLNCRFITYNTTDYKAPQRRKPILDSEDHNINVLLSVAENPGVSAVELGNNLNISRRSVLRILKSHSYHPYHIVKQQELLARDYQSRIEFCEWAIHKQNIEEHFFANVMFSDESTFANIALPNRRNQHFYADRNPHFIRVIPQRRWSLNVWAECLGQHVIGPYFFEETLNGDVYANFVENILPELLEDIPLNVRRIMWLQQDGAPAHFTRAFQTILNHAYPERWIGRGGPVNWPPRSPDMIPLDFFIWGYVKGLVYREPATTRENMRQRIQEAFASITPEMLQNCQRSFIDRLRICLREDGQTFEHLLK